ncbi:MAG TPA: GNAT family N-acetyltransferase [Blastocatellia bacterium]|nr:GNAT family N-acetyltransferase [Blastocatellia bacterium]
MGVRPEVNIRRLDTCAFDDALRLWNEGFAGYAFDMTLSLDAYLARLREGGLSPELSLAVFVDGRPAGFVLNGVREVSGRRMAWNGGTGVAPEFRRGGLGKLLIEAALEVYREQGAQAATLEALANNEAAIALYKSLGYEITDRLLLLERRGRLAADSFGDGGAYAVARVGAHEVARLDFYDAAAPWQTQWQSVRLGGEALVVSDAAGVVAYALYKKTVDADGNLREVTLYQCAHAPGCADPEAAVARALREAYAPANADCRRVAHNLSESGELLLGSLTAAGFEVFAEQVHMRIDLRVRPMA